METPLERKERMKIRKRNMRMKKMKMRKRKMRIHFLMSQESLINCLSLTSQSISSLVFSDSLTYPIGKKRQLIITEWYPLYHPASAAQRLSKAQKPSFSPFNHLPIPNPINADANNHNLFISSFDQSIIHPSSHHSSIIPFISSHHSKLTPLSHLIISPPFPPTLPSSWMLNPLWVSSHLTISPPPTISSTPPLSPFSTYHLSGCQPSSYHPPMSPSPPPPYHLPSPWMSILFGYRALILPPPLYH